VNSLFPYAMLNPMPYKLVVNKLIDLRFRSLDSFFGFAYVEIIRNLWNKLITYFNNLFNLETQDSLKNELKSVLTESTSQIKDELKSGMSAAIEDALDKMREDDIQAIDNLFIRIGIVSGVVFLSYFIFVLPSDAAIDLTQYNWLNQSLINIKLSIIDLITKPSNPGNPGVGGLDLNIPTTPELNVIKTTVDAVAPITQLSPCLSDGSIGMSTVTPNTPIPTIQTLSEFVDESTQTILDGVGVGKMVETVTIIRRTFTEEESDVLLSGVNQAIKNITD
jgi:hypothetical protein